MYVFVKVQAEYSYRLVLQANEMIVLILIRESWYKKDKRKKKEQMNPYLYRKNWIDVVEKGGIEMWIRNAWG